MKRMIGAFLMAVILLVSPIYAEDMSAEATLKYTSEDTFFIQIPETIIVGETCQIEAVDLNIAPDKTVHVDVGMADDYIEITSVNDSNNKLRVAFHNEDNEQLNAGNVSLASFVKDGDTVKDFTTTVEDTTNAIAGDYTGNVTFYIYCE